MKNKRINADMICGQCYGKYVTLPTFILYRIVSLKREDAK